MHIRAYLNFDGNCAQAFKFYEEHLGGKITMIMPFSQMPGGNVPPEMADRTLHASMEIAGTTIMASDVEPGKLQPMSSAYLCVSADSTPDAERIFAALTNPGDTIMPMQETFFAFRYGIARDQFGVLWMVIHERPMPG